MGRAGDQHGPEDAAAGQVGGRVAQEAQGGALTGFLGVGHDEHGVQGEERGPQLGVGVVVHGLAADRGHGPQQARRYRGPAGGREESRGRTVNDGGVRRVLQRRGGSDLDVLVLHPDAHEPQPHEVEDVGDDGIGREEACAAGQGRGALGSQLLRLLDPGRAVVAANPAREQWWLPSSEVAGDSSRFP